MGTYKHVDENGNVSYTDRPPTDSGSLAHLDRTGTLRNASEDEAQRREQERARDAVKGIAKRGHKIVDYLEYAEYLRTTSPWKLDRVMRELRDNKETRKIWVDLQKYPQFRPLSEVTSGARAGNIHAALVGDLSKGGLAEKWMEATLKEMMKRDRWGAYADVLGDKATTLPTKEARYSNSRLGQYLKEEDARLAKGAKDARKAIEVAEAELRVARASGVTRVGGIFLDAAIQKLNPQEAREQGEYCLGAALNKAFKQERLSPEQYETAQRLYANARYHELRTYLESQSFERAGEGCPILTQGR